MHRVSMEEPEEDEFLFQHLFSSGTLTVFFSEHRALVHLTRFDEREESIRLKHME